MAIKCRLGLHAAAPGQIWNDGHFFTWCGRCGCPLIRRPGEHWRPVPRGHAVVWRPAGDDDVSSSTVSDLGQDLPTGACGVIRSAPDRIRRATTSREVAPTEPAVAAHRRPAEARATVPEPEPMPYRPLGEPATTSHDWRALDIGNCPADDQSDDNGESLHWPLRAPRCPPGGLPGH